MARVPVRTPGVNGNVSRSGKARGSVLSLDKSELPFPEQLDEACRMLGLDLTALVDDFPGFQCSTAIYGLPGSIDSPKYEWVLKWLLNKLSGKMDHRSPCLEPRAWSLLKCLMLVIHNDRILQILTGKKILSAVRQTLTWLRKKVRGCRVYQTKVHNGSSSDGEMTQKKRKRADPEIETHEAGYIPFKVMSALILRICETLHLALPFRKLGMSRNLIEQFMTAFRSDPTEAASITSDALYLLDNVCRVRFTGIDDSGELADRRWTLDGVESYMQTCFDFWSMQFTEKSNVNGLLSRAFAKCILSPALLLLHTFRGDFAKVTIKTNIESILTELIAINIVKPLHGASHLRIPDLSADLNGVLTERLRSSRAVDPTRRDEYNVTAKENRRLGNDEVQLQSKLVCLLFEIAIKSYWSKSHQERIVFLQELFDDLEGSIATHIGPAASDSRPVLYSKAVKDLLDLAVANEVQLSGATIESVLNQVLDQDHEVEDLQDGWKIVSLCLKNNVNTFLDSKNGFSDSNSKWKPNGFLKKLLAKLDASSEKNMASNPDPWYSLKLKGILIPLMRAFADARKLLVFFELWQIHLDKSASLSMWEDDGVLSTAQEMIEPCLSAEQINAILESIESRLARLDLSHDDAMTTSNLVMLDCIVGGRYGEDSQLRLSNLIFSVCSTLATILLKSPAKYGGLKWRVWRILTRVNQTWVFDVSDFSIPTVNQQLIEKAFQIIDAPSAEKSSENVVSFQEQSFAFNFMISLSLVEGTSSKSAENFRVKLKRSVDKILDLNNSLCHQIEGDLFRVLKPIESQREWSGRRDAISSHDDLYLSCIVRLLFQPTALNLLEGYTQKRMLNQLSLLAGHEKKPRNSPTDGFTYSWLWDYAQSCEAVYEQKAFAESLRHCQCNNLKRLLDSKDRLDRWASEEKRTPALESLLNGSASQLNPDDKVDIANRVLEDLLRWKNTKHGSFARHLQLLTKVADVPRKYCNRMKVFQQIRMENDELQERSAVFVLAQLVVEEVGLFDRPACDNALCDLTRIILRYIYGSLTMEASARYFTAFYQWIGAEIEREHTDMRVCADQWTSFGSMLLVTMTALHYYSEHRQEALKMLDPEDRVIENIRQQHFKRVLQLCTVGFDYEDPNCRVELAAILECLHGYLDLFLADPRMLEVHDSLLETITRNEEESSPVDQYGEIRALYLRISYKMPLFKNPDAIIGHLKPWESAQSGWTCFDNPREPHVFQDYVSSLDCEALDKILPEMTVDYQRNVMLGLTDTQKTGLQPRITKSFLSMCDKIQVLHNPRLDLQGFVFIKIMDIRYLNVLLSRCSKTISQHMIETLLSAITFISLNDKPADIFVGLTRLFGTVLECHRWKLRGRYHLVVPLLQALIRHLFTPYGKVPVEVPPNEHMRSQPTLTFDASHARLYARLLTTMCDPSPSAVASSNPRQQINLNDETKKAREVAGQHLQYLVMTYCECRISGNFAAKGIREALEPGLWAVIRCLGDDVKRTMNAAMDPNGRAIWKKLYEDWKKFGEWQPGQKL